MLVPGNRAEVWDCVAKVIRILIIDDPGGVGGVGVGCHGRTRVDNKGVFLFVVAKNTTRCEACLLVSSQKFFFLNLATWLPTSNLATKLGNLVAKFKVGSRYGRN